LPAIGESDTIKQNALQRKTMNRKDLNAALFLVAMFSVLIALIFLNYCLVR
jgi:hypothetical protein